MERNPMLDAPMNEYETALFTAVGVLMVAVLELGADPNALKARLKTNEQNFWDLAKPQAAATLALLGNAIENAQQPE